MLAGIVRHLRGIAPVASRASPRPSDPRETPFFPVALAAHGHRGKKFF
jgi:hypothetical protein